MKKRGFSFVEIMIAISILTLAVFPFVEIISNNMKLTLETQKKHKAVYYAKELLEEIKLKNKIDDGVYDTERYNGKNDVEDYSGYNEKGIGIVALSSNNRVVDSEFYRIVYVGSMDEDDIASPDYIDVDVYGNDAMIVIVRCKDESKDEEYAKLKWIYRR